MTMDAVGRVIQVESSGLAPIHYTGRVTAFTYDLAGRLVSQSLPGGRTVAFTYDAVGNLTSLAPRGQPAHTFAYNAGNLATSAQAPSVAGSTGTTSFTYSREKELLSLTRADSAVISIGYDAAGRANRVTSPDGVHTVSYDPTTGQVTGLSAPGGVGQTFTYNGALPATTTWAGPVVKGTVEMWYDEALRPSTVLAGGQALANIFYSRDGLPTNIGSLVLSYRPDNALLESVRGARALTTFEYDSLGQVLLAATVNAANDDTLFRQGFTYDRLGRLTGLAERIRADTVTYAYGYDAAGRLAEVRTGAVVTASYTYDLNGNRTRVVTPSQTVVASYDAQDRLLSAGSATYAHAATGERTMKIVGTDTTRTRYDSYGNLRDVYLPDGTHVAYVVDAQQRRTARLVNGVVTNRWLYQSQLAIAAEVDSAGTPIRTFTYGTHGNVPDLMTLANGRQYRLITDHLGSVRLVIDVAADTVLQQLAYDAYGRVVVDTKPGFQPFGYAGGLYDPLTGLVRFGARDYDAEAGRWTAADPIGLSGGAANLYEYAAGEPVDATDVEGEKVVFVGPRAAELQRGFQAVLRVLRARSGNGDAEALLYLRGLTGIAASNRRTVEVHDMRTEYGSAGETDPLLGNWIRIDLCEIAGDPNARLILVLAHEFGHAYGIGMGRGGGRGEAVGLENVLRRAFGYLERPQHEGSHPIR